MISIRWRLFAILLLATGLIWLSAVAWLQYSSKAQIQRVLDSRLAAAGHMVSALLSDRGLAQTLGEAGEGNLSLPDFRSSRAGWNGNSIVRSGRCAAHCWASPAPDPPSGWASPNRGSA